MPPSLFRPTSVFVAHTRAQCSAQGRLRPFSSSVHRRARAVVYTANGRPSETLRILTFPSLSPPAPNTLNIKYLLSPINPSDINVIEGVYPAKPSRRTNLTGNGLGSKDAPVFIAGNEGLAEVQDIGDGVKGFKKGDWVVMVKPQAGTWSTEENVQETDVIRIPEVGGSKISEVHGACMTVNPPTAYNMLKEFVDLKPGDWVIQNGANSAVGQAVIQIAHHRGLKTINIVRDREDQAALDSYLKSLGATVVLPTSQLSRETIKHTREEIASLTEGASIQLALNCVSGPTTTSMLSLLGPDAHLVSYGAMSKQPLSIPTGLFIFKNLKCHGFWQSKWYKENGSTKRKQLMEELVSLMTQGNLKEPSHNIISISSNMHDDAATNHLRSTLQDIEEGRTKTKILLRFE